jgi:hypothetical protein
MSNSVQIKGLPPVPKGWEFSNEFRPVIKGEHYLNSTVVALAGSAGESQWMPWQGEEPSVGKYLIATPIKQSGPSIEEEPSIEEIPVDHCDEWYLAGPYSTNYWPYHASFAGAVYEHPNGGRVVFGFTHPIFVRAHDTNKDWTADWLHFEKGEYTHMIRPVAILKKVTK